MRAFEWDGRAWFAVWAGDVEGFRAVQLFLDHRGQDRVLEIQ